MRWSSNWSRTISLYLVTKDCWDVTSLLLTGRQTLHLNSPSRVWVEISKQRFMWSPGLSANVNMYRFMISISDDLYAPSMGDLPAGCVYGALGPHHLWENSSMSVWRFWSWRYNSLCSGCPLMSITRTILSPCTLHSFICFDMSELNRDTGSVCRPLDCI